ncbi:hypothetical protein MASR1M12_12520 [Erysipelotrichia bacterium]
MLSYFIVGRVFREHILKPKIPTLPGQILGLFAGVVEAGAVIAVTGFALSYIPTGNFKMENSLTAELGKAVEQAFSADAGIGCHRPGQSSAAAGRQKIHRERPYGWTGERSKSN